MTGEKKATATKYHRRALMTAADRLLVEHGYDGMNMNLLAKEAGYSKATVYVYFRSKDELVCALCNERIKLLFGELRLLVKSDLETREKVSEIERVMTEFATEDSVYFDFVTTKAFSVEPPISGSDELKATAAEIWRVLSELFDARELEGMWYAFYGRIKTKPTLDAIRAL